MNTTLTSADLDPRRQAMLLYFQGYRVARIAEMLGEKVATVHSWKKRDKWGDYGPLDQMQLTTAARYCQLIMKEQKEGKDFKTLKRRITYMMKEKRKGMLQRGIMVAVSALTVVASAGTIMAYEPVSSSDESFEEFISDDALNNFGDDYIDYDSANFVDFSQSDYVLIDSNGVQVTSEEDDSSTYALCTHSMIPATFYTHAKNSSGGCTIKVYNCQRCEKCGYRANAQYDHTITYAKCPH